MNLCDYAARTGLDAEWLAKTFGLSTAGNTPLTIPVKDAGGNTATPLKVTGWDDEAACCTTDGADDLVYNVEACRTADQLLVLPSVSDVHVAIHYGMPAVAVAPTGVAWGRLVKYIASSPALRRVVVVSFGTTRDTARRAIEDRPTDWTGSISVVDATAVTGCCSIAEVHQQQADFRSAFAKVAAAAHAPSRYTWDRCGTWLAKWVKVDRSSELRWVQLANFSARVVENLRHDDGERTETRFRVRCSIDSRSTEDVDVSPAEFRSGGWWLSALGGEAVVYQGYGHSDHMQVAAQLFGGRVPDRLVLEHLGWRKIEGAEAFVHGGGLIRGRSGPTTGHTAPTTPSSTASPAGGLLSSGGQVGQVDRLEVQLPGRLNFTLPAPSPQRLRQDLEQVRRILGLGWSGAWVLWCAVWRAVLGPADFLIHVFGPTGAFKSSVTALFQQFFGAHLDSRHAPGSWLSTANSIEALTHAAKDVLVLIDNLVPRVDPAARRNFERIVQAVGDQTGRGRVWGDGRQRRVRAPRGLIVSTGEELVGGESTVGRTLALELRRGDISPHLLAELQEAAADGAFARVMAAYLEWVAPQVRGFQNKLQPRVRRATRYLQRPGGHARTAEILANLMIGADHFLLFCHKTDPGFMRGDLRAWHKQVYEVLREVAVAQAALATEQQPATRFLDLLRTAFASGAAHLGDFLEQRPASAEEWGWVPRTRQVAGPNGEMVEHTNYSPRGHRIGWTCNETILLDPEAAVQIATTVAAQAEPFSLTRKAVSQALFAEGLLIDTELKSRGTYTSRRVIHGARRPVWVLRAGDVLPAAFPDPAEQDLYGLVDI